jgi:hypothetical protein
MGRVKMAMALTGMVAMLAGSVPDADAASVRVRCEKRLGSPRSKISVDGTGLAGGLYTARVVSGAKSAVSAPEAAVGDEVEFDFDSSRADVAKGATRIAAGFIGTQVHGEIVSGAGAVVASATVPCKIR